MNQAAIIEVMKDALGAMPGPDEPEHALGVQLQYAANEPGRADRRLVRLVSALRDEPSFEPFNGSLQVVGNSAVRVELQGLAGWLLRRAKSAGPEEAVSSLSRYLAAAEIPFGYTLALAGMSAPERCLIASNLQLMAWPEVPDSPQKRGVQKHFSPLTNFHEPTAALVGTIALPKLHAKEVDWTKDRVALPHTEMRDVVLCIGLVGPTAPYVLAHWLAAPDWAPVFTGTYTVPYPEGLPAPGKWPATPCDKVRAIHQAFGRLTEDRKERLRLAMQRLNSALRRQSEVDTAIDLGIVLEGLFLADQRDDRGELGFRLRVRAARYLGSTPDERRQLLSLIRDLYDTRSVATHTGRVPEQTRGRKTRELLDEGLSLVAAALIRLINEGDPDWEQVVVA